MMFATIRGSKGEFVGTRSDEGSSMNFQLQIQRYGGRIPQDPYQREQFNRSTAIPYMSAADLLQNIVAPFLRTMNPDRQVTNVRPVSIDLVQFSSTLSYGGQKYMEEAILRNTSVPCTGSQNDLNSLMYYYVAAPAQTFPGVKDQLWQILSTFEPAAPFGSGLIKVMQICANMRQQNIQALSNMAMNNIRANQNIMRNTVGTTIKMAEQRRQEGDAWLRVFSGTEIARDPATGQRYEVPVGGQYIYGNDAAGRVIRSDRPLTLNELPTGFKQLESAGLY
jgi:hypothetical protein